MSILDSFIFVITRPEIVAVFFLIVGLLIGQMLRYRKRDMDEADSRRRAKETLQKLHFPRIPSNVNHSSSYFTNSRGMQLYSQEFVPVSGDFKAVIGICHGFGDHCNALNAELAVRFCKAGFAVLCMDGQGHGYSDGLHACVHDVSTELARDFSDFFLSRLEMPIFKGKPFFVYGESMGGAVNFYLSTAHAVKKHIAGSIFSAPMVKVADEVTPNPLVIEILKGLAHYFPYAPITPLPDIMDLAFKRPEVKEKVRSCKLNYAKPVRLRTALAMKTATDDINAKMEQLDGPVLILHGAMDRVTDPQVSKALYERCSSTDKSIQIYPNAWHTLISGEPPETADKVFSDIVGWINKHCPQS